MANGVNNPNPISKLTCNKTSTNLYLDVAYSPTEGLVATGDNKKVFMFQYKADALTYLLEVDQPKSEETHFTALFPPKSQDLSLIHI